MQVWRKWNPNPCLKSVGDCAVRAVSAALGLSWHEAYDLLCAEGRRMCNLPSADEVWGNALKKSGYYRWAIPYDCNGCYTADDFCNDNPDGIFVLAFGGHVATVRNGMLLDSWDSSRESPVYVWGKERPKFL